MKNYLFLLVLFVLIGTQGYSQSPNNTAVASGDPVKDLPLFLKPGKHAVELLGVGLLLPTGRQAELNGKVMKAMQQNIAWFRDTLPNLDPSEIHYDKYGLTKEEFDEYTKLTIESRGKEPDLKVIGNDTLEIVKKGNLISFKNGGKLRMLDSVQVNLENNSVIYKGYTLTYTPYKGASNAKGIGYSYKYEEEPQMTDPNKLDIANMNMISFEFAIGQVKDSGKILITLLAIQMVKGKPTFNANLIARYNGSL